MKDILHFSHANGFPASTYRTLFDAWRPRWEVRAIERIGHDPRYPVTLNWPHLVDELLERIAHDRTHDCARPVWLVGHSLGGFLSLMAAMKKPHWVRGVVMLDSPIIAGWRSGVLRLSQWAGLDERFSPAAVTRKRRTQWESRDAAWQHFHSKPVFAKWDKAVLADYVDHGTRAVEGAPTRVLTFERDIEYRIYRTLPRTIGARAARGAPVPVAFIAGKRSKEIAQVGLEATQKLVGPNFEWIDGSHLFPMEEPLRTARLVEKMLDRLAAERSFGYTAAG